MNKTGTIILGSSYYNNDIVIILAINSWLQIYDNKIIFKKNWPIKFKKDDVIINEL